MLFYIVRRILLAVPTLWFAGVIIFFLLYLTPGDSITALIGPIVDLEVIEQMRETWGLNEPLHVKFITWSKEMVKGNLGVSYRNGRRVSELLALKAPITIILSLGALTIATLIGIPVGVICSLYRNTLLDRCATSFAIIGVSMPSFWLAYLLVYMFSLRLGWLPALGYVSPMESFTGWLSHAILPMVCLSFGAMARITRMTRSSMLEVLREDYITTARSKGLREYVIVLKHMFKNAIIPVITVIGMSFSGLLAGVVTIELVLSISGMGRLLISALTKRDAPVVQGIVLWIALSYIVINLVIDVIYALVDPRIRYS